MALAEVPPLFAGVLRFAEGDSVGTPFGGGCVLASGDRQAHVAVRLDIGATLYARVRSGVILGGLLSMERWCASCLGSG